MPKPFGLYIAMCVTIGALVYAYVVTQHNLNQCKANLESESNLRAHYSELLETYIPDERIQ